MRKSLFLPLIPTIIILFCAFPVLAQKLYFTPYEYGAVADGITNDTKAIQAAIDSCHTAGGGKVLFYGGKFLSGTLYLKSNVNLHIEQGAVLLGSDNLDDYPTTPSIHPSYDGKFITYKMLLHAEDAINISITGKGMIDGRGDSFVDGPYLFPSFSGRPRIIYFAGCTNVTVKDVTLYNAASWVQTYQSCRNVHIHGITVDSRENKDIEKPRFADVRGRNTDGMDIVDCQQVRISDCYINSGDDGICLKSLSPDEGCRDVVVTNCIVSTNASGIKIGTETAGIFEDICIQNCVVYDTRKDAIGIMSADGAQIRRITVSNISVRNIKTSAIFISLGNRNRLYRDNVIVNKPCLEDIIIENVQGTRISAEYGCSVTGMAEIPIRNITIRNINLTFVGGEKVVDTIHVHDDKNQYPGGNMFGVLPSYGFYIRHVSGISMENIMLRFLDEDTRPALICDNVKGMRISRLHAEATEKTPELLRLINCRNVAISESGTVSSAPVFLSLYGDKTNNILSKNNKCQHGKEKYFFEKKELKKRLHHVD